MAGIEIREYSGDFEDVIELSWRVWIAEYAGKTWAPLPDAEFLRQKFAPETGAICLVAYEAGKLIASVFALPRMMRFGDEVHPVAMCGGFTVEPSKRRVALPLTERLRRLTEERGAAAGIGLVLDDPTSPSFRFWMKFAEAYPKTFRIAFKGGIMAKFLRPESIARAGIARWERVASRTLGPLLRGTVFGNDPNIRPYRSTDLDRCLQLTQTSTRNVDWAMQWTREELSAQLDPGHYTTLVYERDGVVQAFVNTHSMVLQGREKIWGANIDVWAEDDMTALGRAHLVGRVCKDLRAAGMDALVAPRMGSMPTSALAANLFMPASRGFYIGLFPTDRTRSVPTPKTWSFEVI